MPRNVDYGTAIAVLPISQKIRDDWQSRDADANLPGTSSRLVVQDLEHAKKLADSCSTIWSQYVEENAARGPRRGRKPGSGFRTLLDQLDKVLETKPEPKQYTSAEVTAELGALNQENKEDREKKKEARKRKRNQPKGSMDVYRHEARDTFGDIKLRVPILVEYGEWRSGECAFVIRFDSGPVLLWGQSDTRESAWSELATAIAEKRTTLEEKASDYAGDEDEETEDARWAWLFGLIEEPVPDVYRDQWQDQLAESHS